MIRSGAKVAAITAALALCALARAVPAVAGTYAATVLGDGPSMYWRLGEADGATTAADATGNGFALMYQSGAILDLEAGIQNDSDTSLALDGSAATSSPGAAPSPGAFEAWVRADPPDSTAQIYSFTDSSDTTRMIYTDSGGLLHATVYSDFGILERMVGPSLPAVTDGLWHYVVVDFETGYITVDLTTGPPPIRPSGAVVAQTAAAGPASITLGGSVDVQLDEVAVYPSSLTAAQMSAHASAGGLGWDSVIGEGGEESAPTGCKEAGVFWNGTMGSGSPPIVADGTINYITTAKQRRRCGKPQKDGSKPTFISGQTTRIYFNSFGHYVEWGPAQYLCNASTTCWGLYFNFKLDSSPNDICFLSFRSGGTLILNGCPAPSSTAMQAVQACNPVGTHGWRVLHEGSSWVADFLCDTTATNPNWTRVFSHSDLGVTSGLPDTEAYAQGYKCGSRTPAANCWRREGFMGETHSNFQWRKPSTGSWNPVAGAMCRLDTSYRWDGRQVGTTPPISVQFYENHRSSLTC